MKGGLTVRLLICAGGTGGGVYPALSVLQALKNDAQPVLWVGGEGGMEAGLVTHSGVPYTSIPAAGLHGVGLRTLPGNLLRIPGSNPLFIGVAEPFADKDLRGSK